MAPVFGTGCLGATWYPQVSNNCNNGAWFDASTVEFSMDDNSIIWTGDDVTLAQVSLSVSGVPVWHHYCSAFADSGWGQPYDTPAANCLTSPLFLAEGSFDWEYTPNPDDPNGLYPGTEYLLQAKASCVSNDGDHSITEAAATVLYPETTSDE